MWIDRLLRLFFLVFFFCGYSFLAAEENETRVPCTLDPIICSVEKVSDSESTHDEDGDLSCSGALAASDRKWAWDYCYNYDNINSCGVWLPEGPPLFRQFLADPRQVTYSAGWRFNDNIFAKNTAPISFGDTCGIYRWYNPCGFRGAMQIELEGALWAIFKQTEYSSPLVNADYYVAIPLTYAVDCWSFRFRVFHISSHIGDEYLLENADFDRRNPSAQYVDFSTSYYFNPDFRVFGVAGIIAQSDKSFRCRKFYLQYGLEKYFSELGSYTECSDLLGRPYFGLFVEQKADHDYKFDTTVAVGYEWRKLCGLCRCLRVFGEYHSGFSTEGQFCRFRTSYLSFRVSYGY